MANPTLGNVVTANGDGTSSFVSINLAGGANYVTGNLPVTNIAPGSTTQILLTNGTTPTWTTVGGDTTISATGSITVNKIQGITISGTPSSGYVLEATSGTAASWQAPGGSITLSGDVTGTISATVVSAISGTSPIVITPSNLQFTSATTTPTLSQATAASGTGAVLKIQAQNITSGTGGGLTLTSGTGTAAANAGAVLVQTGGTTRLTANATGVITIANLSTGVVHSDSSGNLTSSSITVGTDITGGTTGQVLITNGTTPTWTSLSSDVTVSNTGVTTVNSISGSTPINITPVTLQWTNAVTAPKLTQVAPASVGTTPGTAATTLTITSQAGGATTSNSGTGGNGGTQTMAGGVGGAATTGTGTNTGGVGGGATIMAGQGGAASGGTTGNNGGNGGNIVITSGAGGVGTGTGATTGLVGNVNIQTGGTTQLQVTPTTIIATPSTIEWTNATTSPTLTQAITTSLVQTANMTFSPQPPSATSFALTGTFTPTTGLTTITTSISQVGFIPLPSNNTAAITIGGQTYIISSITATTITTTAAYAGTGSGTPQSASAQYLQCGNIIYNMAGNSTSPAYNANANSVIWQTNGTTFLQLTPNGSGGGSFILGNTTMNFQASGNITFRSTGGGIVYEGSSHNYLSGGGATGVIFTPSITANWLYGNDITTSIKTSQTAAANSTGVAALAGVPMTMTAQQGQSTTDGYTGGTGAALSLIAGTGGVSGSGTGGTGGNLVLSSGVGQGTHAYGGGGATGSINFNIAGTNIAQMGNYNNSINGDSFVFLNAATLQSNGALGIKSNGNLNLTPNGASPINLGRTLGASDVSFTLANALTMTFANTVTTSVSILQTALASVSSGSGTAGVPMSFTSQAGQAITTATGSVSGGTGANLSLTAGVGGATSGAATTGTGGSAGTVTIIGGAGGAASGATTNNGGAGGNAVVSSGAGGVGTQTTGANGNVQLQIAGSTVEQYIPTVGTHNSQTNRVDSFFGNCETVSSATATQVATYTTASATGGIINMSIVSRATTIGTGIAVGDTGAANYTLTFRNVAGTVALSTAGITLVGTAQTTNATFTAPVLTTTISGAVITINVTNVALCTVDSEVQCHVVVC